ncbi:MAG: choice-of-anchor D domain-containing protein, partial [Candidatus Marinimicrobia bacterium]|nr:choice-of-anchor D domain-containing protein [Candidatus Neomarinimicrobiota bacterium]
MLASDGAADDLFGISISISGDYALMGANRDGDNGVESGSAYLFKRNGTSWAQEAKLLASDGAADDWFGYSVSIAGGYAVVGAWKLGVASSAYVYNGFNSSLDGPFDMDISTLLFSPNGAAGYDVNLTSFSFDATLGNNLFLGDDSNIEINFSSGFSFPYFGTTWSRIQIASNGFVTFGDVGNSSVFDRNSFYPELPMIAAFWGDVDPSAGGGVFFKEEATKITVTWNNLPEFSESNSNTIQLVLFNDGSFQITYNGVDVITPSNGALTVGFNSGRANPLTQSVDFSNTPINGGSNDVLFEFFGPPAPNISLSPDPLNFGDVNSGDALSMQLSISNDGSAALDVTNITVSNSDFSVASPTSFQVSAGSTLNKTISFNPASTGVKSATLTVTNNSSNQQTATVALGGIGITPPVYDNIGEFKITASDGAVSDNFGFSVSISGDYAVVGARFDDDKGANSGSAYLFKRSGTSWVEEAKLLASDGAAGDWFGYSVSISGDNLIVGAVLDGDNGISSGSAYNYSGSALNLPSISLSPDPLNFGDVNSGDSLKMQLSITNNGGAALDVTNITVSNSDFSVTSPTSFQVSAGSTLNKTISFNPSSTGVKSEILTITSDASNLPSATVTLGGIGIPRPVYTAISEFKITASDGVPNDQFGVSVSISGDYAIVGAEFRDDNGTDAGSAYVYKRSGTSWAQEVKLLPADGAADDRFGISVSISGDYAVVGAWLDDDNGTNSGSAYVFK